MLKIMTGPGDRAMASLMAYHGVKEGDEDTGYLVFADTADTPT